LARNDLELAWCEDHAGHRSLVELLDDPGVLLDLAAVARIGAEPEW
jgi:hypothetical protein